MLFNIMLNIIFSVVIIAVGHHLLNHFRDAYTSKKSKDLVDIHTKKYKDIIQEIQQTKSAPPLSGENELSYISPEDKEQMVAELRELLI